MGVLNADQQKEFNEATTLFVGCILSVLIDRLVEVYMCRPPILEIGNLLCLYVPIPGLVVGTYIHT